MGKDEGTNGEASGDNETLTCCGVCGRLGHAKAAGRKPKANIADENGAASSSGTSSQAITTTAPLLVVVSLVGVKYGMLSRVLRIA